MRSLKFFVFFVMSLFLLTVPVKAASFGLTTSKKEVSPNEKFTIKVGGDAIGRVNLTISNGTLSSSSVWVEQNYIEVSVTAGVKGVVKITATPVVGFSDTDANLYNPGAKSVSVTIVDKSSSSNSSQSNPNQSTNSSNANSTTNSSTTKPSNSSAQKKSSNNNLAELKVSSGTLSPSFEASKKEYTLELSSEVKELNIDAVASDKNAKIKGSGKVEVKPGNNTIEIVVTAEDGSKKTYTIKAYVEEAPEIFYTYQDKKIGIVKNLKGLEIPEGFTKEEETINETKMTLFTKENLTLVYGQNEEKENNFYVFDKEKNEIISKCTLIVINNKMYYLVDTPILIKEVNKEKINISDTEVECATFQKENNYCFLNAINDKGEILSYLYEKSEGTMQLFPEFLMSCEERNKEELNPYIFYFLGGVLLILCIGVVFIIKEKKGGNHANA